MSKNEISTYNILEQWNLHIQMLFKRYIQIITLPMYIYFCVNVVSILTEIIYIHRF